MDKKLCCGDYLTAISRTKIDNAKMIKDTKHLNEDWHLEIKGKRKKENENETQKSKMERMDSESIKLALR